MLDVDSRPEQVSGPPARGRRWRMPWFTAAMSLLIFVGVLVLMYPSVAGWFSQYNQSLLIEDVVGADVVEVAPPFDPSGNTALVGATLMYEALCLLARSHVPR